MTQQNQPDPYRQQGPDDQSPSTPGPTQAWGQPYGYAAPSASSGADADQAGYGQSVPGGYGPPSQAPQPQGYQPTQYEPIQQYPQGQYPQAQYPQAQYPLAQSPTQYGQGQYPAAQGQYPPQYGQGEQPYGQIQYGQGQPGQGPYGQQPYGQPQGWTGVMPAERSRRPVWKTVLGWILIGIGSLGTLGLMSNIGSGRFGAGTDSTAEFIGYIFGTMLVSLLPLVLGILLVRSKK